MNRKMRVLVVENDPSVRDFVGKSLGEMFTIVPAGTLAGAKLSYSESKPDAILVDLDLPCSKGLPTLDALQAFCADTPIVVFSGAGDTADYLLRGAQDVVNKDGNVYHNLHVVVAKAIARHKARHAYDHARAKLADTDEELSQLRNLFAYHAIHKLSETSTALETPPTWGLHFKKQEKNGRTIVD